MGGVLNNIELIEYALVLRVWHSLTKPCVSVCHHGSVNFVTNWLIVMELRGKVARLKSVSMPCILKLVP